MTININKLPVAAEADAWRVGQYLAGRMWGVFRVTHGGALTLAASLDRTSRVGCTFSIFLPSAYHLITETQAIELAKTMEAVHQPWRDTWPKEGALPPFDSLRPGDSFMHDDDRRFVLLSKYDDNTWNVSVPGQRAAGSFVRRVWDRGVYHSFERAEPKTPKVSGLSDWVPKEIGPTTIGAPMPTNIGEIVMEKMINLERQQILNQVKAEFQAQGWTVHQSTPPHPGYANKLVDGNTGPDGLAISDRTVDMLMTVHNCAYADRQEQDKQSILRQWREPWRPSTNGLGSISCALFKEGGRSWKP